MAKAWEELLIIVEHAWLVVAIIQKYFGQKLPLLLAKIGANYGWKTTCDVTQLIILMEPTGYEFSIQSSTSFFSKNKIKSRVIFGGV
jgi:K+ transporter